MIAQIGLIELHLFVFISIEAETNHHLYQPF